MNAFTLADLEVPDLATFEHNLAKVHWKTPGMSREQILAAHHASRGGKQYQIRYNVAWHMAHGAEQFALTNDWIFMIPPFEAAGWGDYDPIAYATGVARRILSTDTPHE